MEEEGITIEQLPSLLVELGKEFEEDNEHVTTVLTVLALSLLSGKEAELRKVMMEHFVNPNASFFTNERAKELRKGLRVIR